MKHGSPMVNIMVSLTPIFLFSVDQPWPARGPRAFAIEVPCHMLQSAQPWSPRWAGAGQIVGEAPRPNVKGIWGFPKSWGDPHSWMVYFMEYLSINWMILDDDWGYQCLSSISNDGIFPNKNHTF